MEKLNTKLKQLSLGVTRKKNVLDAGKIVTIRRHVDALRETVREANDCKRAAKETKIENGESFENINNWNDEVEEKIGQADVEVWHLAEWLSEKEHSKQLKAQGMQFNTELKKMKAELGISHSTPEVQEFTGSSIDWPRFWDQFTEAIDKSSIPPITKFTYLRELLGSNVKRCVEALPFTVKGYNRAKEILSDRYGKESEIVNSYVKQILELPHVSSANPRKMQNLARHCHIVFKRLRP